jgi:hypothetical protein
MEDGVKILKSQFPPETARAEHRTGAGDAVGQGETGRGVFWIVFLTAILGCDRMGWQSSKHSSRELELLRSHSVAALRQFEEEG